MSGRGNPFVVEGLRRYFSEGVILRTYPIAAGALGLALVATWPRTSIETALRSGVVSDTFTVVAMCFLLVLVYLGARYGAEDFSSASFVPLREYVTLTPVSLVSVVGGRLTFAVLHTVLLLLMGAPFLAAAMAVGGAGFPQAFAAAAVIGTASCAARMFGLLVLSVGGHQRLRGMLLLPLVAAALIVTFFLAPLGSPVHALAFLLKDAQGASACLACAAASAAAAVVFSAASWAVLAGVRGRWKRTGSARG